MKMSEIARIIAEKIRAGHGACEEDIEKALANERQDVIDFFKNNCCCMAMEKHIEKLKEVK